MTEPDRVEQEIARLLARYLDGSRYDAIAALDDVVPELSAWLGRFFQLHLAEAELWSPYWGVDDAIPAVIESVDTATVAMTGFAWLLADTSVYSQQPFHATFRLAPSHQSLVTYTLRLGDAGVGLGAAPDRARRSWPEVQSWLFEFDRRA